MLAARAATGQESTSLYQPTRCSLHSQVILSFWSQCTCVHEPILFSLGKQVVVDAKREPYHAYCYGKIWMIINKVVFSVIRATVSGRQALGTHACSMGSPESEATGVLQLGNLYNGVMADRLS